MKNGAVSLKRGDASEVLSNKQRKRILKELFSACREGDSCLRGFDSMTFHRLEIDSEGGSLKGFVDEELDTTWNLSPEVKGTIQAILA